MADVEKVLDILTEIKMLHIDDNKAMLVSDIVNGIDEAIQTIRELQSNKAEDFQRHYEWGMHEGYERAKEQIPKWHYCKDGDLPSNDDERFYLCISENHEEDLPTMYQYDSELGFGFWCDYYHPQTLGFLDREFKTLKEEKLEKVIAWRELPKFEEDNK